jgi:hypothetical protein
MLGNLANGPTKGIIKKKKNPASLLTSFVWEGDATRDTFVATHKKKPILNSVPSPKLHTYYIPEQFQHKLNYFLFFRIFEKLFVTCVEIFI